MKQKIQENTDGTINKDKNENQNRDSEVQDTQDQDIIDNKDTAAASYFLILSPILLLTRKDSAFIQHHASQAFVLLIIFAVLWILGGFLSFFSWLTVGVFFVALIGFVQAIQGEKYEIPYIHEMVKDGVSFTGIINGTKKSGSAIMAMIIGLFPKNTENNAEKTMNSRDKTLSSDLEKRVEKLEKEIEEMKKN